MDNNLFNIKQLCVTFYIKFKRIYLIDRMKNLLIDNLRLFLEIRI